MAKADVCALHDAPAAGPPTSPEPDGDALAACFRKSELFETPYARESTREDRVRG